MCGKKPPYAVPLPLRGDRLLWREALGHGNGYLYPHDYPGHPQIEQQYLPNELVGVKYFEPAETDLFFDEQKEVPNMGKENWSNRRRDYGFWHCRNVFGSRP